MLITRDLKYRPPSGQRTRYQLTLPYGYDAEPLRSWPLAVYFHGWGGSKGDWPALYAHGRANGYIVAAADGFDDGRGAGWGSWNVAGSTDAARATCHDPRANASAAFCYPSCGACRDSCQWTTCEDSVAQALALLREVRAAFRVDASKIFAIGVSNGGMFVYALAASTRSADLFAGFVPVIASPHRGFNVAPLRPPAAFLGIWGQNDTTMPPHSNPSIAGHPGGPDVALGTAGTTGNQASGVGWLYTTARAATRQWGARNGCRDGDAPEPCDERCLGLSEGTGSKQRQCVAWRQCDAAVAVVECIALDWGHSVPPGTLELLSAFMRRHRRRVEPAAGPDLAGALLGAVPLFVGAADAAVELFYVCAALAALAVLGLCAWRRRRRKSSLGS